jgi:translation initiation factor 3 subunit G
MITLIRDFVFTTLLFFKTSQVTRQIRLTLSRSLVSSAVASRKSLAKFGKEQGKPSGPHSATTTVGENIKITLRPPGVAKVSSH